jgi:hypothetical protein
MLTRGAKLTERLSNVADSRTDDAKRPGCETIGR